MKMHSSVRVFINRPEKRVFWFTLISHAIVAFYLYYSGALDSGMSRDTINYHLKGIEIAQNYLSGDIEWNRWIDHGWYQFIGLIYSIGPDHILIIQLINVFFAAWSARLVTDTGILAFPNPAIGITAGLFVCFFPSFAYYLSLGTKDAVGVLAACLLVWGLTNFKRHINFGKAMLAIILALLIYMSIRLYMVYILSFVAIIATLPWGRVQRFISTAGPLMAIVLTGFLVSLLSGFGFLLLEHPAALEYYNIEYINEIRGDLARGSGAIEVDNWGENLFTDIENFITAIYYFFFSIDVTDVDKARQLIAVPEMLVFLIAVPALIRGSWMTWKNLRHIALPILLVGITVMAVYGSTTTNMGALFRWRMQALPFLILIMIYGASFKPKSLLWKLTTALVKRLGFTKITIFPYKHPIYSYPPKT